MANYNSTCINGDISLLNVFFTFNNFESYVIEGLLPYIKLNSSKCETFLRLHFNIWNSFHLHENI